MDPEDFDDLSDRQVRTVVGKVTQLFDLLVVTLRSACCKVKGGTISDECALPEIFDRPGTNTLSGC